MTSRIFAAILLAASPSASAETLAGSYSAQVLRVIDGDTFEARIRIWVGQDITTHIRILGIDAPELHGHCPGEREAAQAAHAYLSMFLAEGQVQLSDLHPDKFGNRMDASVRVPSGQDVAAEMLKAGHALPAGRGRVRRCG